MNSLFFLKCVNFVTSVGNLSDYDSCNVSWFRFTLYVVSCAVLYNARHVACRVECHVASRIACRVVRRVMRRIASCAALLLCHVRVP